LAEDIAHQAIGEMVIMTETALEKAQRKFEQAKAALEAVKAREVAAERKKDTRRKIVLGGALLDLAKSDKDASTLVTKLIAGLIRDQDKKLFEKAGKKEAKTAPTQVEAAAASGDEIVTRAPASTPSSEAPPLASMPEPQSNSVASLFDHGSKP